MICAKLNFLKGTDARAVCCEKTGGECFDARFCMSGVSKQDVWLTEQARKVDVRGIMSRGSIGALETDNKHIPTIGMSLPP